MDVKHVENSSLRQYADLLLSFVINFGLSQLAEGPIQNYPCPQKHDRSWKEPLETHQKAIHITARELNRFIHQFVCVGLITSIRRVKFKPFHF